MINFILGVMAISGGTIFGVFAMALFKDDALYGASLCASVGIYIIMRCANAVSLENAKSTSELRTQR